ncbi:MAG: hypothetical protein AAB153_03795, partial [Pseudomonadota bacterium]
TALRPASFCRSGGLSLRYTAPDSMDGGRSGPSWPSRGITPSLEGRGRTASGDCMDAGGRATLGARLQGSRR